MATSGKKGETIHCEFSEVMSHVRHACVKKQQRIKVFSLRCLSSGRKNSRVL